jgi:hypothetical protein
LWGTHKEQGEAVDGMLKNRLSVSVYAWPSQRWIQLKLHNVLVIDELPVPFHLSLSALKLWPHAEVQNGTRFTRTAFTESYHGHPYWNRGGGGINNVGNLDIEGRLTQSFARM